ncbi:hypothetical protein B6D29_02285 [Microgenomates bacterium UTCPR1]|nr:MAG: hypothetical protein B6D29_02285 [Microgenomates bacterium UTCPR1]
MTLIIGTTHWKGICLSADTRATLSNGTYQDNFQKIAHIQGGIGMAAAGDAISAIMFRETLQNNLNDLKNSGKKFPDNKISQVIVDIIKKSLIDVKKHSYIKERPIYEVNTVGLIGINLPFAKLNINYEEANLLLESLANANKPLNSIYGKIIEKLAWCANSKYNHFVINEFHQSLLFTYKLKLFDDEDACIYELTRVPFGKIVALGSGSSFNYPSKSPRILSWVLFTQEAEDIEYAALHLTSLVEYAELEVPNNDKFGFKTFGGSILAAVIRTNNNIGSTDVVLGDLGSKVENRIISRVYEKSGKLWIETRQGKNLPLLTFPNNIKTRAQFKTFDLKLNTKV